MSPDSPRTLHLPGVGLYILLAIAYLVLAVVFTKPLVFLAGSCTPMADGSMDQYQTIWSFWWLRMAVFDLGQNPYWTDWIYYPHGTGLGYHLSPFTGVTAIVVSAVTGIPINSPLVYNILLFVSFVVTGLGTFAIARHVSGCAFAGFIAGVFVAVSPFRLWHLNHLNLLSLGWGLWTVYFALRFLDRPRIKTALTATLFFGMIFYSSLMLTSFVALFMMAYVASSLRTLWQHQRRTELLRHGAIATAIAAVIAAPGLAALHQTDSVWTPVWQNTLEYSADLQALVLPSGTESIIGQLLDSGRDMGPHSSDQAFVGWLLLVVVAITLTAGRRRVSLRWLVLAGVFCVLALGPSLQVWGNTLLNGWLPYRWLFEFVPYLNLSRTPIRLVVLVHFCLVVFAAQGIALGMSRMRGLVRSPVRLAACQALATLAVGGILFMENTKGSLTVMLPEQRAIYADVERDPRIRAVFEGPKTEATNLSNFYMYFQTMHGKKLANGYLTHHSRNARRLLDALVGMNALPVTDLERLASAGVDGVIYHDPSGLDRIVPLR